MAGMRGLGRVFDLVLPGLPVAATGNGGTVVVSLKECSGVSLVSYCNNALGTASVTVTAGTSSAAQTTQYTPANGFGQPTVMYTQQQIGTTIANLGGTASWVKNTTSWGPTGNVTLGGGGTISVIDFFCSELADTYTYLKFAPVATNTGLYVFAIAYDLDVQRTPANITPIATL